MVGKMAAVTRRQLGFLNLEHFARTRVSVFHNAESGFRIRAYVVTVKNVKKSLDF